MITKLQIWQSLRDCDIEILRHSCPKDSLEEFEKTVDLYKEQFKIKLSELIGVHERFKNIADDDLETEILMHSQMISPFVLKFIFLCRKTSFLVDVHVKSKARDSFFQIFKPE